MPLKKILVALFIFTVATLTQAQNRSFKPEFSIGLSASQVQGDAYGGFDKPGLVTSYGVNKRLQGGWNFNFALQLAQKGSFKRPNTDQGDFRKYGINLWYIEAPARIEYRIKGLSFFLGLSIGGLIYANEFDENGDITGNPEFEKYELASMLGFRYFFKRKYFFELSTGHSLLPVRELVDGPSWFRLNDGQYNTWLYTKIGLRLGR